ncbi:hypothetical protein M5K25_013724 [Dendrobium thyrsiflorum]|uniref:Uncharacterized protein n=1 Tax=Dendrobium thyrsiflorum TaxID=117978 RepID=A0ABD0UU12_DENTH
MLIVESSGSKRRIQRGQDHQILISLRYSKAQQTVNCGNSSIGLELEIYYLALRVDGGDDRPDQDPMVPSSCAIVIPGILEGIIGYPSNADTKRKIQTHSPVYSSPQ